MDKSVQCSIMSCSTTTVDCGTNTSENHIVSQNFTAVDHCGTNTSENYPGPQNVAAESTPTDPDTDTLLKIFLDAASNSTLNTSHLVQPFTVYTENSFGQFGVDELDRSTNFDISLENRYLAFYGDFPYQYGNIKHKAKPFSDNVYLCKILEHLNVLMPELNYNSALITKYRDGNDFLNYHSDNEVEICPNSDIVTLSFGVTRVINFRPKTQTSIPVSLQVNHGELFIMSRESQDIYEHSVPKDNSSTIRISVTLRLIKPLQYTPGPTQIGIPTKQNLQQSPSSSLPNNSLSNAPIPNKVSKSSTLFISSSMFSGFNPSKLSSNSQDATVLYYRGATVEQILNNLQHDPKFLELDPKSVNKIYILCGTNNVDKILGIPHSQCSSQINMGSFQHQAELLNRTFAGFNSIHGYLSS